MINNPLNLRNEGQERTFRLLSNLPLAWNSRRNLHDVLFQNNPTHLEESHRETVWAQRLVTVHSSHYLPDLPFLKISIQPPSLRLINGIKRKAVHPWPSTELQKTPFLTHLWCSLKLLTHAIYGLNDSIPNETDSFLLPTDGYLFD
jgi:hypothetical protein